TSFQQRTAAARRRLAHRGRTLALRQRPAKLSFHRSDRVRLLTSNELSLTTNITSRNTTTATATCRPPRRDVARLLAEAFLFFVARALRPAEDFFLPNAVPEKTREIRTNR